ncbi:transmembrane protein, putative [Medicago truncatula]|uniref:Transmembrane protein, putative n=1 Tax=Medicago truncatula TaxID=3880 RepID=A0A072VHE5_MEDTR|nr:transmembrane protein, putative [Medicago truncatula]
MEVARMCNFISWDICSGNADTLINSDFVLRNVVLDAKRRGCFHNDEEEKNLARAALLFPCISCLLVPNHIIVLPHFLKL